MIEGSEFPHLMRGEKVLLSSEGVKIGDGEGRETEEGSLYVTNIRLIFHGKPASFAKNLKRGGREVAALSFFLENVGDVRAQRDSKELELEYHVDRRFSSLSCNKVIIKGLAESQIGRIILLVEEFKRSAQSPEIPQEKREERRHQGVFGRILEVINPDEGRGKTGGKRGARQVSFGVSESVRKKKEEKIKKEEEELLKIPPELDVEGELELMCPACGEWIKWKPGMLACPVCKKKMNPFTGKVID